MSKDIRSFFGAPKGNAHNNKSPAQKNSPISSNQNSGKKESDFSEDNDERKRKAGVYDQEGVGQHTDIKKLKKMKDIENIDRDMEKIAIDLTRRNPRKPSPSPEPQKKSVQKQTYTSDNLDDFKFGDRNKRKRDPEDRPIKSQADIRRSQTSVPSRQEKRREASPIRKKEPPRKGKTTMEIENDGNGTDVTEVISDDDRDSFERTPSKTPTKNVKEEKKESLRDLANKARQNKPVIRRLPSDDEDEEEEEKGAKGKRGKSSAKKGKAQDTTIQGPFSGNTIVITGVMVDMSRDNMTDLLKMLGAKVTGSVSSRTSMLIVGSILEDGRPVSESRKYKTAQEKGTKILTESELDDLIYKKTGKRMSDGIDAFMVRSNAPPTTSGTAQTQSKSITQTQAISSAVAVVPKKKPGEKSTELWTQKYAPRDINDVLGNQNFIKEIMTWLKDWHDVVILGNKKEVKTKFVPGKKGEWGGSNVNARACLISGPPGIGKTTAVRLIAKKLGYDIIEQNASDIRNKKAVEALLKHLTDNSLLCSNRTDATNTQFLILMDEVDGMSAGDRGGSQALIQAIKTTKTPIICICNDRQNSKIRSLANYCLDIKFHKPPKQTVAKRMAEIAANEGLSVDMNSLEYMCETFGNDIRQMLNLLQMYARKSNMLTYADAKGTMGKTKKDETVMMNNFDAARRVMTGRDLSIRDKTDLFFIDYDLIPLLVQENYLSSAGQSTKEDLEKIAQASDAIATGDILNRKIRQYGDWGLMPQFAFMSSIYPCEIARPNVGFPQFPAWLGKNSSTRKRQREIKELRSMMSPSVTGTRLGLLFDYTPAVIQLLHYNITNAPGSDHDLVENVIEILDHYHIDLEMAKEYLPDLQLASAKLRDPFADLSTQTKSLLTRTYNSRHKTSVAAKKSKKVVGGAEGEAVGHKFNPEAEEDEEEEEETHPGEDENEEADTSVEVKVKETKKGKGKTQASATKKEGGAGGKGKKK